MPQISLFLDLDGLDATRVEDACFNSGALSVVLTDRRDDAILEPAPGEVRLWPATRLQALFDIDWLTPNALAMLAADCGCTVERFSLAPVEARVWEREWLRDFQPMRFGNRLWICPSHATVDDPHGVIVSLDPGLAFGTGTHPTTRLCLERLDERAASATTDLVIDYGCGSGVLAIAALKLAARRACAYDIDPQALIATADNARANAVDRALTVCTEPDELPLGKADLVLANILSGPLCTLAPALTNLLRPGGELVLAGLLDAQTDEVIAAYAPTITLQVWRRLDGWSCLVGTHRGEDRV